MSPKKDSGSPTATSGLYLYSFPRKLSTASTRETLVDLPTTSTDKIFESELSVVQVLFKKDNTG